MTAPHDDPADDPSAGSRASATGWAYAVVPLALLLALLVRTTVVESYAVPDAGMEPTLGAGDRVLIGKWGTPDERGRVVVADMTAAFGWESGGPAPASVTARLLAAVATRVGVQRPEHSTVARIVAVEGDRVACTASGAVSVNEEIVSETALCPQVRLVVPTGSVWLLGDDAGAGPDSLAAVREGGDGMVEDTAIVGPVVASLWPLGAVTSRG